jgi:hypothetical protein
MTDASRQALKEISASTASSAILYSLRHENHVFVGAASCRDWGRVAAGCRSYHGISHPDRNIQALTGIHADKTEWKRAGKRRRLRMFVARVAAYFHAPVLRGASALSSVRDQFLLTRSFTRLK